MLDFSDNEFDILIKDTRYIFFIFGSCATSQAER